MPLLFIGSGLMLILTGVKGNPSELWGLVQGDFEGENNYLYWMIAILVIGSLGYIDSLRSMSRLFVALILIVLLLDNKGFFAQLQAFIDSSKQAQSGAHQVGG